MKKNSKIPHNTIEKQKPTKIVFDEYRDMFTLRMKPITPASLEKIGQELIEWALHDTRALKITQFFHERGIGSTTIKKWRDKHPSFDETYVYAKEVIGNRREMGGLQGEYDSGMVRSSMPIYDDEWRSTEEWRSKLKDTSGQQGNVRVVIEQYPSTDKVPDKEE